MQKKALVIAGIFFEMISILQLTRFILKIEVIVAGHAIPLWASLMAFVLLQILGLWMFKATKP